MRRDSCPPLQKQSSLTVRFPLQREEQSPSQELEEEQLSSGSSEGSCSSKQPPLSRGSCPPSWKQSSLAVRVPLQREEQSPSQELGEERISSSSSERSCSSGQPHLSRGSSPPSWKQSSLAVRVPLQREEQSPSQELEE